MAINLLSHLSENTVSWERRDFYRDLHSLPKEGVITMKYMPVFSEVT